MTEVHRARDNALGSANQPRDLEGKVAFVTGAASGIGRAAVVLLRQRGARVIAEDINPDVKELGDGDDLVPFVSGQA